MPPALKQEQSLGAPGVGTWQPSVPTGQLVREGMGLGMLYTFGLRKPVVAPQGTTGHVVQCASDGLWVEYGQVLIELGELSASDPGPAESVRDQRLPNGVVAVLADTDGTVFLRPEPSAKPFVSQGDEVSPGETIALVEVMKTFTPVRALQAGVLERICVHDGAGIGEGQVLFWLRPG